MRYLIMAAGIPCGWVLGDTAERLSGYPLLGTLTFVAVIAIFVVRLAPGPRQY